MDDISQKIIDKVRQYVDNSADINAPDHQGEFLFIAIINSDSPPLLKDAIKKGLNVNQGTASGWTALHEAMDLAIDGMIQNNEETAYPEPIEMIKILLDSGADLQQADSEGKIPLDSLNTYSSNTDTFNHLKNIFRTVIPDIDDRIKFKRKTN